MDKLLTAVIIIAAVWYLFRRFKKMVTPGQGCGCGCDSSGSTSEKSGSDDRQKSNPSP